jgi:sensor domain CHASE-containing protein/HPt (histidine-containing phosphotransfer) domain-containing protein
MSLRRKTLLFVAGSLALLVVSMLTAVYAIVGRGFARVEEQQMRDKVTGLQAVVTTMVQEHAERLGDWAQWDDCADFLQDGNQAWIDSNISPDALTSLGIDVMTIQRSDGTRPLAVRLDEEQAALVGLPPDLEPHLAPHALLRGIEASGAAFAGIVMLADGPWLFNSRPILRTDGTPPPMPGRLLTGVRLDEDWVARLRKFTFLDIAMLRTDALPDDEVIRAARAELAEGAPTVVRNLSSTDQAGFALYDDLYGRPELMFFVERPRSLREHTNSVVRSAVLALCACGVAVALLALIGLRKFVVEPLDRLLAGVRNCEAGRPARVEIRSGDEFDSLAGAFNRMASTIAMREAALVAAHDDLARLFDNLRQGVLAFGPDGRVTGETSRRAPEIFRRGSLEGTSIVDLLYGDREEWDVERQAFAQWPPAVFDQPASAWHELAAIAPSSVVLGSGTDDERHVALEFRPIVAGERIERVMLLATDESEKHRLLQESLSKDQRHAREMEAMQRRAASGSHLFARFLRQSEERLAAIDRLLRSDPAEAFRLAHTLKGEARLFELQALEAAASELEDRLDRRTRAFDASSAGDALALARTELGAAQARFVQASPIGAAVLDQVPVQQQDLEQLADVVIELADRLDGDVFAQLRRVSNRLSARPFGELVAQLCEQAPVWAAKEHKQAQVSVTGRDVPIPPGLAAALGGALTHVLRNAVAHGVEPQDERERRGKEALAQIALSATETPLGPQVVIADDGAGIDRERVRSRAVELGLAPGDELELVFADGMTTHESANDLCGRGVGLSAVREDLARVGYAVRIESEAGRGTRVTIAPRAQ